MDIHSSILRGLAEIISEPLVKLFSEKLWKTEEIPKTGRSGNCRTAILLQFLEKARNFSTERKKEITKGPQGGK